MDSTITSLQNPRIRQALRLRARRGRQQQEKIIIDGGREILRASDAGCEIREVFFCAAWCEKNESQSPWAQVVERELPLIPVTEAIMERLAYGGRTDGLVAVADLPAITPLSSWEPSEHALVAVLEAVEKPGNVGALVRTADASGVSAVILADAASDPFSPNAIRASVGTVFSLPIFQETTETTLAWLQQLDFQMCACRVDGKTDYRDVDWTRRSALILGSEAHGLTQQWDTEDVQSVVLPMLGIADSLNVSTTGAILFYEALRQRRG
ncbi:MAG: RNA methyltransferase [Planctomycetaceae bacterium]|nr:RNA methyltransferase [Planctomycetaceae bacterium]